MSSGLPAAWAEGTPQVAPPKTIADAVRQMHAHSEHVTACIDRLEKLFALELQTPEYRPVQIPDPQTGSYTILDKSPWIAKSIGILNPSVAPVYLGIGGGSANLAAKAPSCPASSSLVLPVEAQNLELACNQSDLAGNTAIIFVFRFVTVQPLVLRQVP